MYLLGNITSTIRVLVRKKTEQLYFQMLLHSVVREFQVKVTDININLKVSYHIVFVRIFRNDVLVHYSLSSTYVSLCDGKYNNMYPTPYNNNTVFIVFLLLNVLLGLIIDEASQGLQRTHWTASQKGSHRWERRENICSWKNMEGMIDDESHYFVH